MSRSVFPNGVDEFTELFDLPFDKVQDANRLTALKMQAQLSNDEQIEMMALTSELQEYLITPETWNKFTDAIQAVEKFFYANVQGFIENKQKIWDSYIKQFVFVGKWKSGADYKFQNLVSNKDGDLYICKSDHKSVAGNAPELNSTLWAKLSSKGDKGDIGLNAFYKGDWNATTGYKLGDAVCFGRVGHKAGLTFIALKDNTGKSPDKSPDDWTLYQQLFVGTAKPLGAAPGLHFIKEV